MNAEILSLGSELLMGEITDTNAPFIASRLPPLGIRAQWVSQVGDDMDMLVQALGTALKRSEIIFTTGGLGPTQDDLTREAIAACLGEEMVLRDELLDDLRAHFQRRGSDMPSSNLKQATLIPSARSIPNRRGTAPGWWVERDGKTIVAMPGPPDELRGIWDEEVTPKLRERATGEAIVTRNIKVAGISEGGLAEMVAEYMGVSNPYLGIYAKSDGIHLRMIARAPTEKEAFEIIRPVENGLVSVVGGYIWGYDDESPEQAVGDMLKELGLTMATIEYGSGGLLASTITERHDSHRYYRGGQVLVHDEGMIVPREVGLPSGVVQSHGIVSPEAAGALAAAARTNFIADLGIGISVAAGPEEIDGAPPGTVHIGIALPHPGAGEHGPLVAEARLTSMRLPARRLFVRRRAVATALIELRRTLQALPTPDVRL